MGQESQKMAAGYIANYFQKHNVTSPANNIDSTAFLYTGIHGDCRTPADTPDKIDYQNLENIVLWLIKLVLQFKK
ncbi:MAG: hypothetical protein RBR35_11060 [Salinivirgaceae bacterium]|nr:hypothetical protein [Salinivirgaceae bacterium]